MGACSSFAPKEDLTLSPRSPGRGIPSMKLQGDMPVYFVLGLEGAGKRSFLEWVTNASLGDVNGCGDNYIATTSISSLSTLRGEQANATTTTTTTASSNHTQDIARNLQSLIGAYTPPSRSHSQDGSLSYKRVVDIDAMSAIDGKCREFYPVPDAQSLVAKPWVKKTTPIEGFNCTSLLVDNERMRKWWPSTPSKGSRRTSKGTSNFRGQYLSWSLSSRQGVRCRPLCLARPWVGGIIFMLDSTSSKKQLNRVRAQLLQVLKEPVMRSLPIVVLANKNDLENAMCPHKICNALRMNRITDRPWTLFSASMHKATVTAIASSTNTPTRTNKFTGVQEPFAWLSSIRTY